MPISKLPCNVLLINTGEPGKAPCSGSGPEAEMKDTRMVPFFVKFGMISAEIGFTLLTIRLSRLAKGW